MANGLISRLIYVRRMCQIPIEFTLIGLWWWLFFDRTHAFEFTIAGFIQIRKNGNELEQSTASATVSYP